MDSRCAKCDIESYTSVTVFKWEIIYTSGIMLKAEALPDTNHVLMTSLELRGDARFHIDPLFARWSKLDIYGQYLRWEGLVRGKY